MVVGHGTRDADGLEEFWTLAGHVREAAGELPVGFGFIELAEPLVDTGIDELVAQGSREVVSVPLVLLAAGHLKNDGPAALTRARSRHPGVHFHMGRDLGIEPIVLDIVEERARAALGDVTEDTAVVLVGRGSSDPDATSRPLQVRAAARGQPRAGAGRAGVRGRRAADRAGGARALPAPRREADRGRAVLPVHRHPRAAHLRAGGRVRGAASGAGGARRRAHRPGPAARPARDRALPRGAARRRAHELRPVHVPRAAAGLRGQGRHADLAHAPRRRSRARVPPVAARHPGAAQAARAAARRARRARPDDPQLSTTWATRTRTAPRRWRA